MTTRVTIRFRRGVAADWALKNPILEGGEPGLETDTGKLKIGDDITPWNDLEYFTPTETVDSGSLLEHINSLTPHPVYDDGPSLALLYENVKAG